MAYLLLGALQLAAQIVVCQDAPGDDFRCSIAKNAV